MLVRICSFLDQPRDRGRLACASSAFGRATAWRRIAVGQGAMQWSVVEESARRWVQQQQQSQQQQSQQPQPAVRSPAAGPGGKGQSWLRRMQAMQSVQVHGLSAATVASWSSLVVKLWIKQTSRMYTAAQRGDAARRRGEATRRRSDAATQQRRERAGGRASE